MRLLVLTFILLLLAAPAAAAAPWRWPVPERSVARTFSVGADRFAAGQHRGVDLAAPVGTPVRVACGGRVRFAGTVGDAGLTVSVACGGLVASYLHLGRAFVRRGAEVSAGDVLGTVGRSGQPRGAPHLHLGARRAEDGRYVDPLALLGGGAAPGPTPLAPARPGRPPALGRAPRPAAAPRAARVPRAAPAAPAVPAPRTAAPGVPWAALAGLVLVAAAAAPATIAGRRRVRTRLVHGAAAARR